MKPHTLPTLLVLASGLVFSATPAIQPNLYLENVKFLAAPELRGRASGSPELEQAADYIARKFREFKLQPLGDRDYYQAFSVTTAATLGKSNRFRFTSGSKEASLRFPEDFVPLHFSPAAKLQTAVVFAGYGITAPNQNYDDYAGLDVKGKIVLVLRHEPQEFDEKSVFAGKNLTEHSKLTAKATNAKMHGAAAVILINDGAHHSGDPDELEKFGASEGPADAGIPFVHVKQEQVQGWFKEAGKSLEEIQAGIDRDLKPRSFALADSLRVNVELDIAREVKTVHNVAGYLPGETDEYVVIGAHYDHLGLGGHFSLAPSMIGTVHPGADDNASGTSGLIELARWFSSQPKQKRGVLFLAFAGEELGLLGSAHYVANPRLPLAKAVAMINMDMIGRPKDGKVYVGGTGTGSTLKPMLERVIPKHALKVDYSDNTGYGSSDHTSFTIGKVPVLFFFSGLHSDYHKPSDTWDKIDAPAAAKLVELIGEIADELRTAADRPEFIRVVPAHGGATGPITSSSGSGYGPWFGSIPDFGEGVKGVKFADVREGSPAARAGFRAGDVMIEFDGKPIQNLYDFTYALQSKKPGDEVKVKVLRDGQPIEAVVLLARRS
jgi:Zn-dependent M28 family amino/carboxypeptidase